MNKQVIIIGAGGHAKVIADIIVKSNDEIVGFLDCNKKIGTNIIYDKKVLDTDDNINKFLDYYFIIAIGDNKIRKKYHSKYNYLKYYTAIHPLCNIGLNVNIGEGTCVMANCCINSSAIIGKHCIINTGSIIEHDNIIGNYSHISPNAVLGGTVNVGNLTHIGIGATVKNNITIGNNSVIGAGSTVIRNIPDNVTVVGNPSRIISDKS